MAATRSKEGFRRVGEQGTAAQCEASEPELGRRRQGAGTEAPVRKGLPRALRDGLRGGVNTGREKSGVSPACWFQTCDREPW